MVRAGCVHLAENSHFPSIIPLLRSAFSECPQDPGLSRRQGMVTDQQPPAVETSAQAIPAGCRLGLKSV